MEPSRPNAANEENDFYAEHNVLNAQLPYRFVRGNPRFDEKETLAMLKAEVDCDPYPVAVPWLSGYFALPRDFGLQQSASFQSGRIYGQDVSSGAAVAALMSNSYDCDPRPASSANADEPCLRVLDLCCCPGLKLCAIADSLRMQKRKGVVVGVDVSESRMAVCKRILDKYQVQLTTTKSADGGLAYNRTAQSNSPSPETVRIRLYSNDGTTFASLPIQQLNLVYDSAAAGEDDGVRLGKRKRMNKSARARSEKRLKEMVSFDTELRCADDRSTNGDNAQLQLFDLVLVDAECSTDGSVVHMQQRYFKSKQKLSDGSSSPVDSQQQKPSLWSSDGRLSELVALQRNLAATGFRLLRRGGYMVYSTCSLSEDQNEGVVQWLMNEFPDARVVSVDFATGAPSPGSPTLKRTGRIKGTVQFLPNLDQNVGSVDLERLNGGGFFLAKIVKS